MKIRAFCGEFFLLGRSTTCKLLSCAVSWSSEFSLHCIKSKSPYLENFKYYPFWCVKIYGK
jgi:hypothetical protein